MKNIFILVLTLAMAPVAFSASTSDYKKIGLIQMSSTQVYFAPKEGKWGGDCPNASWAYYNKAQLATNKEFLSLAMAAKATSQEVRFRGTCSSNGNYIELDVMYVK